MNKIEKLEQAHEKLDGLLTAVEPALIENELAEFCNSLADIKAVAAELKHEATL